MDSILFRNTAAQKGRSIMITPQSSDFRFISAGRIILDNQTASVTAVNPGAETTLLVLHGTGTVDVDGHTFQVSRFDGVYVPRGAQFTVTTQDTVDIFEGSAPTEHTYPAAYVPHQQVKDDPAMHLMVGSGATEREIYKSIAENVQGARLLTGVTMSKPGNWTSWPPHEHAATQEELYLYFDIPKPGFGMQYLYQSLQDAQPAMIVYQDDAVVIAKGYHPNVAAPGFPMNFAWLLCSTEEHTYRKLGGVNVQPEFQEVSTGLK